MEIEGDGLRLAESVQADCAVIFPGFVTDAIDHRAIRRLEAADGQSEFRQPPERDIHGPAVSRGVLRCLFAGGLHGVGECLGEAGIQLAPGAARVEIKLDLAAVEVAVDRNIGTVEMHPGCGGPGSLRGSRNIDGSLRVPAYPADGKQDLDPDGAAPLLRQLVPDTQIVPFREEEWHISQLDTGDLQLAGHCDFGKAHSYPAGIADPRSARHIDEGEPEADRFRFGHARVRGAGIDEVLRAAAVDGERDKEMPVTDCVGDGGLPPGRYRHVRRSGKGLQHAALFVRLACDSLNFEHGCAMLQRIMETTFGNIPHHRGLMVAEPHHREWTGVSRPGRGRR